MASPTWWTWVWASSGSWWWTGKPGVLQPMVAESDMTERLNWTELNIPALNWGDLSFFSGLSGLNRKELPFYDTETHWSMCLVNSSLPPRPIPDDRYKFKDVWSWPRRVDSHNHNQKHCKRYSEKSCTIVCRHITTRTRRRKRRYLTWGC